MILSRPYINCQSLSSFPPNSGLFTGPNSWLMSTVTDLLEPRQLPRPRSGLAPRRLHPGSGESRAGAARGAGQGSVTTSPQLASSHASLTLCSLEPSSPARQPWTQLDGTPNFNGVARTGSDLLGPRAQFRAPSPGQWGSGSSPRSQACAVISVVRRVWVQGSLRTAELD